MSEKEERRMTVTEEMKVFIRETVSNMKQMNKESLLIMKSNSEVLRARDNMDREMQHVCRKVG